MDIIVKEGEDIATCASLQEAIRALQEKLEDEKRNLRCLIDWMNNPDEEGIARAKRTMTQSLEGYRTMRDYDIENIVERIMEKQRSHDRVVMKRMADLLQVLIDDEFQGEENGTH